MGHHHGKPPCHVTVQELALSLGKVNERIEQSIATASSIAFKQNDLAKMK